MEGKFIIVVDKQTKQNLTKLWALGSSTSWNVIFILGSLMLFLHITSPACTALATTHSNSKVYFFGVYVVWFVVYASHTHIAGTAPIQ